MSKPDKFHIQPRYRPLMASLGADAAWIFTSNRVVVWRHLEDRENCTLDAAWPDGRPIRLHVKRFPAHAAATASNEAAALTELALAAIPCAPLAAWGKLADGRSFLITEDLTGFEPADKLLARGTPFDRLSSPTAELAAQLHLAGFHHRDLYLCHFMVNNATQTPQVKLIDAARVRRLPRWPFRQRWIVKDLAQFWFSMTQLPVTPALRTQWLAQYTAARKLTKDLQPAIEAKSRRIAAHDANLNRREPARHVSIPNS